MYAVAPTPAEAAGSVIASAGGAFITAVTGVLPVLVPMLATLWAIRFVWHKLALHSGADVMGVPEKDYKTRTINGHTSKYHDTGSGVW